MRAVLALVLLTGPALAQTTPAPVLKSVSVQPPQSSPPSIIYDDDCTSNVDCVYTLSAIHHWIDQGNVNVLAFIADSGNAASAPIFKIFNTYYGHNIPIATWRGTVAPGSFGTSSWNAGTVTQFNPGDTNANYTDCATQYRTTLAAAANNSVKIVETGYLTCIQALMQTTGDAISPLTGPQLIQAKVSALYVMGGDYPTSNESNMQGNPSAANYVFANWTTQNGYPAIFLNGVTPGNSVVIAKPSWFTNSDPGVYALSLAGVSNSPSWDILSVHQAVFGLGAYTQSANGTNSVNASTGANTWSSGTASGHYYLTLAQPIPYYLAALDGQAYGGANFYDPQNRSGEVTAQGFQCDILTGCAASTPFNVNTGNSNGGFTVTSSNTNGPGFYVKNNASTSFIGALELSAPNMTAGQQMYLRLGHDPSSKNEGAVGFTYQGSGSNSNTIDFNFFGTSRLYQITAAGSFLEAGNLKLSPTGPTISSGFGTSPSASGTANAPVIDVGTGGTASSGLIGLPTAANGWSCDFHDETSPAGNDTKVSASTTSSVTVTNYSHTAATTQAWNAGDVIKGVCFPY